MCLGCVLKVLFRGENAHAVSICLKIYAQIQKMRSLNAVVHYRDIMSVYVTSILEAGKG